MDGVVVEELTVVWGWRAGMTLYGEKGENGVKGE